MAYQFSHKFQVGERFIGSEQPVFIIAEAGVAHFGSLDKAYALVDMAADAKSDAIKFQVFQTDKLVSSESPEWAERLKSRELPFEAFQKISAYCREKGIMFFATAHDDPSLEFLCKLDVPLFKIGSGEVSNWAYIERVANLGKPVILSTGMYSMEQMDHALNIFKKADNPNIAVLHCVTQYPTPPMDVNLRLINTIRKRYNVIAGYSDHTRGFHLPLAAVALGARVIEKHITLDFNVPNAQDWKVSCGHDDLSLMISQIHDIEKGLGNGVKCASEGEKTSLIWARKSLVAARQINAGEILSQECIAIKRPGTGIAPDQLGEVIGKKAKSDIEKDHIIKRENLL